VAHPRFGSRPSCERLVGEVPHSHIFYPQ
jgi:hypothetical protein